MSIITKKQGTFEYLVAEGISAPHCFTTRLGGVSTGIFDSLNLSLGRDDDPQNVVENYRIFGNAVGFTPEDTVFPCQRHTVH